MWEIATKELKATGTGHLGDVNAIAVASHGLYVASASCDGTVRLWDMRGDEVQKYVANDTVTSVAFFPNTLFLAFGSAANTIGIIDWRSGSLVNTLLGHTDRCYDVSVLPESCKIVSASLDKTVVVWSPQKDVKYSSWQKDFGYSIEKILTGHEVCAEACPLLRANNVRAMFFQSRRQKTMGG